MSNHQNIEVYVNDVQITPARTAKEIVEGHNARGPSTEIGGSSLSPTTIKFIPFFAPQRGKLRSWYPMMDTLRVNYNQRTDYDESRYLIQEVGEHRRELAEKWAKLLVDVKNPEDLKEGDVTPALGTDAKGSGMAAQLDHVVHHPRLKSAVPRKKSGGS